VRSRHLLKVRFLSFKWIILMACNVILFSWLIFVVKQMNVCTPYFDLGRSGLIKLLCSICRINSPSIFTFLGLTSVGFLGVVLCLEARETEVSCVQRRLEGLHAPFSESKSKIVRPLRFSHHVVIRMIRSSNHWASQALSL